MVQSPDHTGLDPHRELCSSAYMGHFWHAFVRRYLLLFVRAGQRFFTAALCAMLLVFSANCALTIDDLKWDNERASVDVICDTPTEIHDDVKLFAVHWATGKIVTDEDEMELRYFSSYADAFFIVDRNAPKWTAQLMPPEYGLNCTNRYSVLPESAAVLPLRCPVATFTQTLAETMVRPDGQYLGQTSEAKTRCTPKAPVRIPVCVRPTSLQRPPGEPQVDEWAAVPKATPKIIEDKATYAHEVENATTYFYFDDKAPPETAYYWGKDTKLRCKGKPAPKPYDQIVGTKELPRLAEFAESTTGQSGQAGKNASGTSATATGTNGSSPSASSSPAGQGPPLDFLDRVSRGISITGALVQGDTSGNLKDPNGSRYGIPNGKNPGGPNLWALQAAVSVFAIVQNPIKTSKQFVDLIRRGLAKGEAVIILNPNHFSKEVAEKLAAAPEKKLTQENLEAAESFGESMAPSLHEVRTIMPYSRAQVFTKGWKQDFQAHHIFEVQMMENFPKEYSKEAIENSPAIILTKAEHQQITKDLNDVRNKMLSDLNVPSLNKQQLWALYQKVYAKNPTWLEAIKPYFQP